MQVATTPQTLELTSPQVALILALEPVLEATGLRVVCPRCAAQGFDGLETNNGGQDTAWKMNCGCTSRTFNRAALTHLMTPSGDLIPLAETLLAPAHLAIRCNVRAAGCLSTPLTYTQTADALTVRCQCWQIALGAGVHTFRKAVRGVA